METLKKLGHADQLYFIRDITLHLPCGDVKALDVYNGALRFTLLTDKCLDIADLSHNGCNLSFISKNGLTNSCNYGTSDFKRNYSGGFVYTCGLDAVGGVEGLPMHGSIHHGGARITEVTVCEEVLRVKGIIRDTQLFGRNLTLERTVETKPNSGTVTIEDKITNNGYKSDGYAILYHCNLGYPFLDEGVRIHADILSTQGVTPFAEEDKQNALVMTEPVDVIDEKVYYHRLKKGCVEVVNPHLNKSITFRFDEKILSNFIEWKSMASGDYALGIEPSTTKFNREFTYRELKPLQSETLRIEVLVK